MTREQILRKVKSCLRLAASSNPNEAAAAMRQAQKLMQLHGLDEEAVELSDVRTESASVTRSAVPGWLGQLASVVGEAFGCRAWFTFRRDKPALLRFVGLASQPKLAHYAFAVLRRQLTHQRGKFFKRTRGKRSNRLGKADQFAEAWVYAVQEKVHAFASHVPALVDKQMERLREGYGMSKHEPRRHGSGKIHEAAVRAGWQRGQAAQLHHGVNSSTSRQLVLDGEKTP